MRRIRLLTLVLALGLVMVTVPAGLAAAQDVGGGGPSPSGVAGMRYTSPQFGFQVSWAAPWALAQDPVSKRGQYDALSLVAGKIGIDYAGIVTALDPAAFFRGAVAVRRQQFPDLVVLQPYLPVSPRLPGILRYTESGVEMIDLVTLRPLTPGKSLLMIAESFPAATSPDTRKRVETAIHLESVGLAAGATSNARSDPSVDPQTVVKRLLETPLSASELPSGYEVQGVAKSEPDKTDAEAIGQIEVNLASGPGPRALAYSVYASDADAQHAYDERLIETRICVGGRISPLTGLADEAALIVVPGSAAAVGAMIATEASVLIRQGNVLVIATAANRDVLDPAAPRAAAIALAQAGLAHLQRVLAPDSAHAGAVRDVDFRLGQRG